ncbi:helix-turn-helix domain-containing protein [Humibacillus xanthopallidus]|uniref:Helix-turn-helix protein n=1 Tax=Humibacillus xanthopallidus TaxID=412689 RepID=A0A543HG01_9MICO|nr:helix-turn-helix transcriptional regulator [Humibacillus xanthopallidus]TQM57266.1 helix-turn-helix protein [Humibacillus xanthopallidus]
MSTTARPSPRSPRRPLLREVYGRLLRGLRTRQGRTLAEVSARAGVSLAYLSEVERGLKEPSSEVLEAICVALGSSVTLLVGAAHRDLRGLAALPVEALEEGVVLDLTAARPDDAADRRTGRDLAPPTQIDSPALLLAA